MFLNRVSDGFGTAAAISGDLALFGADSDDEAGSDVGAAFVYRREGEKLAENWVFIDLLHYLKMQGLDVLGRLKELRGTG